MSIVVKDMIKHYATADIDERLEIDIAVAKLLEEELLTDREISVLEYYKLQFSTKEIAKSLHTTERTIYREFKKVVSKISAVLHMDDSSILDEVSDRLGRELTNDETKFCNYVIKWNGYRLGGNLSITNFIIDEEGNVLPDED